MTSKLQSTNRCSTVKMIALIAGVFTLAIAIGAFISAFLLGRRSLIMRQPSVKLLPWDDYNALHPGTLYFSNPLDRQIDMLFSRRYESDQIISPTTHPPW